VTDAQYATLVAANSSPSDCVVPAVPKAAGGGNEREAVTYYISGLAAEEDDGSKRWTATVVHTKATTA